MISVVQVSKSYGGRVLFDDASLQVNRGDRIGLIGPNGAGKSTLFSLILEENSPDTGEITRMRGTDIGFLPQESAPAGDETVLELATNISPEMVEVRRQLREHPDDHSAEHHHAMERFAELEGYALEVRAKRVMAGLAFRERDFNRPARELSGGWIMRAHLARLLVIEPSLLMLDEPTNHLDLESLGWFQNHLKNYRGALLVISHDREFLNAICDSIVEIRSKKLIRYTGNYDSFIQQREARIEQQWAAYKNQQREIESLQRFADRFRAKASKASQAQDKLKQIERMERIEAPEEREAVVKFRFPQPPRSGHRVFVLKEVEQAYGDNVVYRDLNIEIERGQRTVLVGPNGAGKSTLLKILAGVVPIRGGSSEPGYNVSIGYFSQQRAEMLDASRTVLQEAMSGPERVPEQTVRTILGSFLFRGDDVFKSVSVLSGGEKSRLALVKLLLDPPNLILLDEPTTHLDIASIDALVGALQQFEGTILFVSHDVHFIRSIAKTVLHIHAGKLTPYAGDYDYYVEKSNVGGARQALVAPLNNHQPEVVEPEVVQAESPKLGLKEIRAQRKAEQEKRQAQARDRRNAEARATELEGAIVFLESKQKELARELEAQATRENPFRFQELSARLADVTTKLQTANKEWEGLIERLGEAVECE